MQTESGLALLSRIGNQNIGDLGKDIFSSPLNPPEIIEISGEAGSGKSLLCLDLLATTLLPKTLLGIHLNGLEAGAIFIDCDNHFSILHFADLLERKIKRICHNIRSEWKKLGAEKIKEELMTISKKHYNKKIENAVKESLKRLTYFNCGNSSQFAVTILSLEQCLSNKSNVSVIIVDSISSFYWYDRIYRVESWAKMESYLNKILYSFLDIVKRNYLICICTKQSLFKKKKDQEGQNKTFYPYESFSKDEKEFSSYEFLGKEWAGQVTIRINMTLQDDRKLAENNVHCNVETTHGNASSQVLQCTFHEDGIRWIKTP